MDQKRFTLEEARALLPELSALIEEANRELAALQEKLITANERFEASEQSLSDADSGKGRAGLKALRQSRQNYELAIESLSALQKEYMERLDYWVDAVSAKGVFLRDIREGLLDFPAYHEGFDFLLCWRLGEKDISYWHLAGDGFIGRKPLACLVEYF